MEVDRICDRGVSTIVRVVSERRDRVFLRDPVVVIGSPGVHPSFYLVGQVVQTDFHAVLGSSPILLTGKTFAPGVGE